GLHRERQRHDPRAQPLARVAAADRGPEDRERVAARAARDDSGLGHHGAGGQLRIRGAASGGQRRSHCARASASGPESGAAGEPRALIAPRAAEGAEDATPPLAVRAFAKVTGPGPGARMPPRGVRFWARIRARGGLDWLLL